MQKSYLKASAIINGLVLYGILVYTKLKILLDYFDAIGAKFIEYFTDYVSALFFDALIMMGLMLLMYQQLNIYYCMDPRKEKGIRRTCKAYGAIASMVLFSLMLGLRMRCITCWIKLLVINSLGFWIPYTYVQYYKRTGHVFTSKMFNTFALAINIHGLIMLIYSNHFSPHTFIIFTIMFFLSATNLKWAFTNAIKNNAIAVSELGLFRLILFIVFLSIFRTLLYQPIISNIFGIILYTVRILHDDAKSSFSSKVFRILVLIPISVTYLIVALLIFIPDAVLDFLNLF